MITNVWHRFCGMFYILSKLFLNMLCIVTDFINALPGNSSVNMVQQAKIEEVVFSVDPTNAPINWLDSDHVTCVGCRSMSISRLYK
jgi:hypothetical protein